MSDPIIPPDLEKLADEFAEKADEMVGGFGRKLDAQTPPPIIYHYTDGAGLRGILETGQLWFTDIFNLNDPSELRHGFEPAIRHIRAAAEAGPEELKAFAVDFIDMLRGGIEKFAHYFVCCFSSADDDLGQWRAYADNGRGFAIGFETGSFERALCLDADGKTIEGRMAFPVTYSDDELRSMCSEILNMAIPLISLPRGRDLDNRTISVYMVRLATIMAAAIIRAALFFKHKAYTNEAEYRFLEMHRMGVVRELRYRGRPYSLVRYRELDWRTNAAPALKRIVIGPAADQSQTARFAEDCLREFHPEGVVNISQSTIPYRAP